jgi:hypothetical protein
MTSCEDAPCDNRGYNVCIENTTGVDVLFEFYYAVPLLPPGATTTVQSVTVEAKNSICYRINIPPGPILGVMATANAAAIPQGPFYISGPTHLKVFVADNDDIAVSSDCSPCPVACDRACNKKPSPCKSCA